MLNKLLTVLLIGIFIYAYVGNNPELISSSKDETIASDQLLNVAYQKQKSDIQIGGEGKVIRVLPDDNEGSRHQKFILRLASGQTLLVSHNIDLAQRINSIQEGDKVEFYGEYEWNSKGGVIHWTHHDPAGQHEDGWLKHNGRVYK